MMNDCIMASRSGWLVSAVVAAAVALANPLGGIAQGGETPGLDALRDESTVRFTSGDRVLLEYRYADVPKKPYVSRWTTPEGVNVLRDAPHDHLHHHGLMFAVGVDGVDFWSENEKCGRQQHRSLTVNEERPGQEPRQLGLTHLIDWIAPGADSPLLTEERTISLRLEKSGGVSLLTWTSRLEPGGGRRRVTLGGSHYFGLGLRFVESMDQGGRHFNARGAEGRLVRGEERLVETPWCAYTASAEGSTATVALMDDPDNPRHPATMFTMPRPFAYLSATLNLKDEPLALEAGRPLELNYGVAAWDGTVGPDEVQHVYRRWSGQDDR